jgi:hypothetical protein
VRVRLCPFWLCFAACKVSSPGFRRMLCLLEGGGVEPPRRGPVVTGPPSDALHIHYPTPSVPLPATAHVSTASPCHVCRVSSCMHWRTSLLQPSSCVHLAEHIASRLCPSPLLAFMPCHMASWLGYYCTVPLGAGCGASTQTCCATAADCVPPLAPATCTCFLAGIVIAQLCKGLARFGCHQLL